MISWNALPHEKRPHHEKTEVEKKASTHNEEEALKTINQNYVKNVKQIFQASCFDCHSGQTRYPWYYKIPGAKQLIDRDIREARKHIDMSDDFPFNGHGTPSEDLEALQKSIQKSTMPPFRYKITHWNSQLSQEQKRVILKWIEESQDELSKVRREDRVSRKPHDFLALPTGIEPVLRP